MKQQVKAIYYKHQEPIDKARKIAFRMILLTMSAVLTAVNTKTFISAGNLFHGGGWWDYTFDPADCGHLF
ncbi:hypothetical protein [Eubacterium aggregans]|uniref:hypothetical protein n=1 Tax=Eubacterium aggregans TaxID=81409 RepID=UPI003F37E563